MIRPLMETSTPPRMHQVVGLPPGAEPGDHLHDVHRFFNRNGVDPDQPVALVNAGLGAGTVSGNVQRLHAAGAVHPHDPVFGQTEPVLFPKVDDCGHTGGQRQDDRMTSRAGT